MKRLCLFLVSLAFGFSAQAQEYPTKPIKLIVPFPPAGGTDVLSRSISQSIMTNTKWVIIIDNKPSWCRRRRRGRR
jgi:tripartite-type tricarboxylate transporter receptor subunit TctC